MIKEILFVFIGALLITACTPQPADSSGKRGLGRNRYTSTTRKHSSKKDTVKKKNTSQIEQKYSAEEIYKLCNPAVFTVTSASDIYTSQGSGFFISPNGLAVSNYHVLKGTYEGTEVIYMPSGSQYKIQKVIHYSDDEDFIIFRVNIGSNKVPYLKITNRKPIIGSKIYAIGSPKGLTNTLSSGEISQLRGDNIIQINAPIDHGSSGGALINEYGEVIGITSAGMDDSGANLNFAIDIDAIKPYIY